MLTSEAAACVFVLTAWPRARIASGLERATGKILLPSPDEAESSDYILICGFGRVGQAVAELLTTKLDQLPLKENEQVFKYFIMKPLPEKSRTGKVLGLMKPKNWLTFPMLLVPLYKDPQIGRASCRERV